LFIRERFGLVLTAFLILVVAAGLFILLERRSHRNEALALQEYNETIASSNSSEDAQKAAHLEELIVKYKKGKAPFLARVWLASYYVKSGDLEKAIKYYEEALNDAGKSPMYFVLLDAMAPVYMESNKSSKDLAERYIAASKMENAPNPQELRLDAARMYAAAGMKEEAQRIYREIMSDPEAEKELLWLYIKEKLKG